MRSATPLIAFTLAAALASSALGAQRVVYSAPDADFDVGVAPVTRSINVAASAPITGVGLTALWTGVVADQQDGVRPWSTDMFVVATAPGAPGASFQWGPIIGGDRTIADFPFQDGSAAGFSPAAPSSGTYMLQVNSGNPSPWVIGLRNVTWHFTTTVPDVVFEYEGSTVNDGTRPTWSRPFFIAGVSTQGPVAYEAVEFTVDTSGVYTFLSVVPAGDNFTFLYRNGFDSSQPLVNLLDYGLGNGSAPNGSPRGTSLIEAMLLEGETYTFVVSQWTRFVVGQPYHNTITGPGSLSIAPAPCPADLNGDGAVGSGDLAVLLGFWGTGGGGLADLDGDGVVGAPDLALLLGSWGPC